eukprot:Pgem_evm13s16871
MGFKGKRSKSKSPKIKKSKSPEKKKVKTTQVKRSKSVNKIKKSFKKSPETAQQIAAKASKREAYAQKRSAKKLLKKEKAQIRRSNQQKKLQQRREEKRQRKIAEAESEESEESGPDTLVPAPTPIYTDLKDNFEPVDAGVFSNPTSLEDVPSIKEKSEEEILAEVQRQKNMEEQKAERKRLARNRALRQIEQNRIIRAEKKQENATRKHNKKNLKEITRLVNDFYNSIMESQVTTDIKSLLEQYQSWDDEQKNDFEKKIRLALTPLYISLLNSNSHDDNIKQDFIKQFNENITVPFTFYFNRELKNKCLQNALPNVSWFEDANINNNFGVCYDNDTQSINLNEFEPFSSGEESGLDNNNDVGDLGFWSYKYL